MEKVCSKCSQKQPLCNFSPLRNGKFRVHSICKKCRSAYRRKTYRENPLPAYAHRAVYLALADNTLQKPAFCEKCSKPNVNIQAHHHRGYEEEYWLDVVWLCPSCHRYVDANKVSL